MKTEKITKKRRGLATAGLITILGLSGCSRAISESEGMVLAGQALMQGGGSATVIGTGLYSLGMMRHEKEPINLNVTNPQRIPENVTYRNERYVPEDGYSWVNENSNDLRVRTANINMFASNYWMDFNRNGVADYPDEFVGIKNTFREDESLIIFLHIHNHPPVAIKKSFMLYGPHGNVIMEHSLTQMMGIHIGDTDFDLPPFLIERGGYGNYRVAWYLDEQYIGSNEFELVPSDR